MLADDKQRLVDLLSQVVTALGGAGVPVVLERPKVEAHGDFACNIALQLGKRLQRPPREIAQAIADALRIHPAAAGLLDSVEIAGPGFVNLRLSTVARQAVVREVLHAGERFGATADPGAGTALIEFVSANPTGPLHVGHARQAALGDALANLLAQQGWLVTREFYYNDAGVQIDNLAVSVQARARELRGERVEFPAAGYQGEYLVEVAREFLAGATRAARDGTPVTASGDPDDLDGIRRFAVAFLRQEQDADLAAFGVRFDHYYLESSLYADGRVDGAVDAMRRSGMTFDADGALWLRTTGFADLGGGLKDDKDRVMRKSDGSYTYFVPDVAYHLTKLERGYDLAIDIQGSDHHGTMARVRAGVQAAGGALGIAVPAAYPRYLLHKMVRVMRGGEEVKMSKRAGTSIALRDLLEWAGKDATRFFLVSRKADAEFVFDVDLARTHSDENPVYYVQYAHARICSVLEQAKTQAPGAAVDPESALLADLAPLSSPREQTLLNRLAAYPEVISLAAEELAPHQVAFYLKDLAADLHGFYNAERVLVDDAGLRDARLALLLATRQVLRNGLALIGVSSPARM